MMLPSAARKVDPLQLPEVKAQEISFVRVPQPGDNVLMHLAQPDQYDAVSVTVSFPELLVQPAGEGRRFQIVVVPEGVAIDAQLDDWLSSPIIVGAVSWQPGRAVVRGTVPECDNLIPAVIAYEFYESELRMLEQAILPFEQNADSDVDFAYQMNVKHRPQWDRLYRTMEQLQKMRLRFVRLQPCFRQTPPGWPMECIRTFHRLVRKTHVEERLELLSDRLEACEDLYEGAIDRITDYRMYGTGNLLEWAIVFLLLVEVVLLILQMRQH